MAQHTRKIVFPLARCVNSQINIWGNPTRIGSQNANDDLREYCRKTKMGSRLSPFDFIARCFLPV